MTTEPTSLDNIRALTDPLAYPSSADLAKTCDLVMKGGISSGVIYPLAICELGRTYRISAVGGSSAGAIAAAAAAAAEAGRDSGGFARLATIPQRLGETAFDGNTRLFHLFQPAPQTRRLWRLAIAALDKPKGLTATVGALLPPMLALITARPALFGVVGPATIVVWAAATTNWLAIALALLLLAVSTIIAALASLVQRLKTDLDATDFGLCTGMDGYNPKGSPSLTRWLTDTYNNLAGHKDPAAPVTFGNLSDAGVQLAMFTTNLTLGTQTALPFNTRIWAFKKQEMAALFPEEVVTWMCDNPPEDISTETIDTFAQHGLHPLPNERDLPVVFGVRLSLSFPLLLSAVPLWAFDYTTDGAPPERHLFSDGGMTSNFPMHFFDTPLPSHPTFGINLKTVDSVDSEPRNNIDMPDHNGASILAQPKPITNIFGFLGSIKGTMQAWADNMQTHLPGYRDRIVAVKHTKTEGGLNLNMDEETITDLANRGQEAGKRAAKFDLVNHQWIRYRTFIDLLEPFVTDAAAHLDRSALSPAPTYRDMIDGPPPTSYRQNWNNDQGHQIADAIAHLAELYNQNPNLNNDAPKPTGILQIRPTP